MIRSCDRCGKSYEAKRSTSRYCSSSCRAYASTKPAAVLAVAPTTTGGLTDSVTRELAAAGVLDTPDADLALHMARRIDAGQDTGSAASAWAKTMNDARDRALRSSTAKSRLADLRASRPA